MINHSKVKKLPQSSFLSGTVDEKLSQIEEKLVRMNRTGSNYVVGMSPRIPIMDYVAFPEPGSGIILRKLLPTDCVVTAGYLFIENVASGYHPNIHISVDSLGGETSMIKLPVKRFINIVQPNKSISAGQRLTLAIDPPESCSDLWIGFMLEVDKSNVSKSVEMADSLVKLLEQADEELANE